MLEEARLFPAAGEACDRWSDWKWQMKNRISSVEDLERYIRLTPGEKENISRCLSLFRMAITPYYASLMDPADPMCPIRLQAVPRIEETVILPCELADPLGEDRDTPVKNIVHRYPDRVLLLVTRQCSMYCRHCTRRRTVGEEDRIITSSELDDAVGYIASNSRIRDVLISGGDPLTLSDGTLERILSLLRSVEHVEIIRIGTRVPVVMPMRITPELLSILKRFQPVWINTHFNHPIELTPLALRACGDIVDAGIPLGNQSVLLRHVNDTPEIMKELLLKLVKGRVRPYYLYQCDLSRGIGHFRTRVETGLSIMKALTGSISGYAVPKFVIDAPGGGGKIPVNTNYVVSLDEKQAVLRNYRGDIYVYPQPPDLGDCSVTPAL